MNPLHKRIEKILEEEFYRLASTRAEMFKHQSKALTTLFAEELEALAADVAFMSVKITNAEGDEYIKRADVLALIRSKATRI